MGSKFSNLSIVRPKSADGRIWGASGRMAGLAMIVISALMAGGCQGRDREADEARLQMDEYRNEVRMINQSNDVLRREISDTYASCELIGNQLMVMAAMDIHDKYTDGLGRRILPKPIDKAGPDPVTQRDDDGNNKGKIAGGKPGGKAGPRLGPEINPAVEQKPPPPPPVEEVKRGFPDGVSIDF